MNSELELAEYRLLCQAIGDACHDLRWGQVHAGRRHLTAGLERASDYADSGLPWGDALADEYRRTLHEFDKLSEPYLERMRAFRLAAAEPDR
jgi:hypothetical protein